MIHLLGYGFPSEQNHVDMLARNIERAWTVLRPKSRALALAVTCIVAATGILGAAIIVRGGS